MAKCPAASCPAYRTGSLKAWGIATNSLLACPLSPSSRACCMILANTSPSWTKNGDCAGFSPFRIGPSWLSLSCSFSLETCNSGLSLSWAVCLVFLPCFFLVSLAGGVAAITGEASRGWDGQSASTAGKAGKGDWWEPAVFCSPGSPPMLLAATRSPFCCSASCSGGVVAAPTGVS